MENVEKVNKTLDELYSKRLELDKQIEEMEATLKKCEYEWTIGKWFDASASVPVPTGLKTYKVYHKVAQIKHCDKEIVYLNIIDVSYYLTDNGDVDFFVNDTPFSIRKTDFCKYFSKERIVNNFNEPFSEIINSIKETKIK